jgi:probable O-glycosylation ligase (exosortase A-associated)
VRDLAFLAFLAGLLALGFRRPFLFVLAYAYVDIVSPQRLSYYLLNTVPISMIVAGLAIAGWLLADDKKRLSFAPRQFLMLVLLIYCGFTTLHADFPVEAAVKWEWVWKSMVWAIFLPLALRTKLRIEAYLLFMILSAGAIVIVGGIKTLLSGGGYGTLNLMVENNSGLYEGSTISAVAIAIIPIVLWLVRHGTIFPPDWRVRLFGGGLIFACLLMPVGTEARTGLLCIGTLAFLTLRDAKRRVVYGAALAGAALIAVPFLPASFTSRMDTISGYQADSSAQTRLAVWSWTWDYAQRTPLGGGFGAYRGNELEVTVVTNKVAGNVASIQEQAIVERARAYHSSYFEVLGEQGFPGLILYLLLHGAGLVRMEILRRRYRGADADKAWISPLATALQNAQIICLVGGLFLGIAYQPFIFMLLAVQIAFDTYVSRIVPAKPAWPVLGRPIRLKPTPAET